MMRRLLEIAVAASSLVLLSPVLLLIALAVRLDSPGPILFRQERVGRHGRPFRILKFRSMRVATGSAEAGLQITASVDPRITRVGAVLRRTKLDELPQLFNVLRGDMAIVGPRPEVPRYVDMYPEDARREILSIRPGITDEAAIEFRDEGDLLALSEDPERTYVDVILPRKIELYRQYVRSRSLAGDLGIVLRTARRVMAPSRGGARGERTKLP